ncbi:hypothetical protein [Kribbella kalugense]|uniref:Uncharacterized protein n=1 Tax=Kribbella kalugense TaxID=2512221 RepID=A0A4R7ZEQ2_9ACTN|nr:hypothetical protein [Kribbella kalugense]TDW15752.1 hypothetical protein EV650_7244 [Kribbella kalugense]
MTTELKTLMDQAVERPTTFTPDAAALVATGRHRTRVRRAVMSAATAATAVVAVLLIGHLSPTRTAPQPATVPRPAAITDLCAKSDDFFRTANDDAWRRQVVGSWTDKVVEVTDPDGSMTVRRSPDGSQYAYCVAGVPIRGQALGGFGATLINVGIVTRPYQIQRYWSMAYGDTPVDRNSQTGGYGVRYSYAGRVPEGVTRIAFSGLGQHADATIKDGFWVHRVYTANILTGNTDPIYITMYDAAGKQVFKERY